MKDRQAAVLITAFFLARIGSDMTQVREQQMVQDKVGK